MEIVDCSDMYFEVVRPAGVVADAVPARKPKVSLKWARLGTLIAFTKCREP